MRDFVKLVICSSPPYSNLHLFDLSVGCKEKRATRLGCRYEHNLSASMYIRKTRANKNKERKFSVYHYSSVHVLCVMNDCDVCGLIFSFSRFVLDMLLASLNMHRASQSLTLAIKIH